MGSIHRECMNWQIVPSIQCKSVLIKASAKCINVNVGLSFFLLCVMKEQTKVVLSLVFQLMFSSFSRISSIHLFQFNTLIQQTMTPKSLCDIYLFHIKN